MQYLPPYGSTDPNASYVQGDESAGILGSITPAGVFEQPQREIVAVIAAAGLMPSSSVLTQLRDAILSLVSANGAIHKGTDTGSVNALVAAVSPAISAYADGQVFEITPAFTTTSPTPTGNYGPGIKTIAHADGSSLLPGEIVAGVKFLSAYDGMLGKLVLLGVTKAYVDSYTRKILSADTTFYVSTGGSDTTGSGTVGSPWATKQHAIDTLISRYDLNGHAATIQVGAGADSSGPVVLSTPIIGGTLRLLGDTTTPTNCPISPASGHAVLVHRGGILSIAGFALSATGTGADGLHAAAGGIITIDGQMSFGACNNAHLAAAGSGAEIFIGATELVTGSAFAHYSVYDGGSIAPTMLGTSHTISLSGAPAFSLGFALAGLGGKLYSVSDTYTGGCTGPHFTVTGNAVVMTNGAGVNYFPGSIAGTTSTGGQYI